MKKSVHFLLVCFLLQSAVSIAHTGGHFQKHDGIVLNSWKLESGEIIRGNFSFGRGDSIFIEQEGGVIRPVLIADLSIQDQKFARFKINKLSTVNNVSIYNEPSEKGDFYRYFPISILVISILVLFFLRRSFFQSYIINSKMGLAFSGGLFLFSVLIACSKSSGTNNPVTDPNQAIVPKTSTSFIDSAFAAFKPGVGTSWDGTYFYISSTGIPNHNMMIGITSWQQQVPLTQPYNGTNSWSIPLQPVYAAVPLSTKTNLMKGAVAVAVNGIPIFNALNNRGEDSYKIGELDNWGGHCGRGDDYHYHAAPCIYQP